MRALTLTQPWAGLVASGIKLVENRPRAMIKPDDFGVPFALHASREIHPEVYNRIAEIDPPQDIRLVSADAPWPRLSRITSAVIAVATILCAVGDHDPLDSILGKQWRGNQRRWYFGPVGYLLRDVRALETPIPCRGRLGFWTLPPDVESAVRAQLGGDHE